MRKHIYILRLTLIAFLASACTDFLDVNENPNAPVNVPLDQKLPSVLVQSVNIETGPLNQLGAVWTGYWAKAINGPSSTSLFRLEETYAVEAMSFDRDGRPIWENIYTTLVNYKDIEDQAIESGNLTYSGIAKIMKGWHFMRLVDLYNNVPFSNALGGGGNPNPKYEEGQVVYEGSIRMITEGIREIKEAPAFSVKPGNDDVIFKGDLQLWVKFANTIMLRALLRMSETENDAFIQETLHEIQEEGSGFLTADENAFVNPGYLVSSGKQNPFWNTFYRNHANAQTNEHSTLRPTAFIIAQYKNLNDPRLEKLYALPKAGGDYTGVPLGATAGAEYQMDNTSALLGPAENGNRPAALLKSSQQPSVLLASFESLFLQAEASARGWISGSPQSYYEEAIGASFKYSEVEENELTAYLSQESVDLSLAGNVIERIIQQKWLALNSISSMEAWNDYRRLGIPSALPQSLQSPSADPNYRPTRLTYRQSEYNTNGKEVEKQGDIDPFRSRVFWDK